MRFVEGIRQMSSRELGMLGIDNLAYVKRVAGEGDEGFAVHAADGTRIAMLESRELAFAVVRQNDMEPVDVN